MLLKATIACGAAALLSACAFEHGPACPAAPSPTAGAASAGAPTVRLARGDCVAVNRRQVYDPVAGRYYWRDPKTGRTLWEDGAPRS